MAIIQVVGSLILFYVFLIVLPISCSNPDSEALLKLKESFKDAKTLDSWRSGTEACAKNQEWVGVICDNGVVTGLRLGNMGLSGQIDVDALAKVPGIRSIAFTSNAFSGPIPQIQQMGYLRGIYLSDNQFSGEIPGDYFSKMEGVKKVWLAGNKFAGPIPSSLVNLSYLMELHLENNQFSGTIPLLGQSSLISLDLSYNKLEGEIPPELLKFDKNVFKGNTGICGENIGIACPTSTESNNSPSPSEPKPTKNHKPRKLALWFIVGSVIAFVLMFVGICVLRWRQNTNPGMTMTENNDHPISISATNSKKGSQKRSSNGKDLVLLNEAKGEFGMVDLMKAQAEVLGSGTLGSSYKATMASGMTVVVKRIKEMNKMGKDHFDAQMCRLARIEHKNVLPPIAYHYRKDEKLLIYEFLPKGSLLYLLHGDRGISHSELDWHVRLNIVQGIARGLGYLHTELAEFDLPHGDLKSSNILLTKEYDPLIADYGFSSLISRSQAMQALTAYKSPEAVQNKSVSPKCDVYCLGIMILEILTGKFPSQYLNYGQDGGTDLVQWVKSAIAEGKEASLFDPGMASSGNSSTEMDQLLHIGAACAESDPDNRLELTAAISRIEDIRSDRSQEAIRLTVMPSLRDGYAESSASRSLAVQNYNDNLSGKRKDSVGTQHRANSFAFGIS